MSGSYDNQGGGRGGRGGGGGGGGYRNRPSSPPLAYGNPHGAPRQGITLDGPPTGPPMDYAVPHNYEPAFDQPPPREPPPELLAPTRQRNHAANLATAPIVEAGSVTGRSLTLVISIMCFLACLTAGAVYMMNQSATAWLRNMSNEITVQIEPRENSDVEQTLREVVSFLRLRPGIATVNPLDRADTAKLLEPWLGSTDVLNDLPIPRLIAIEIDGSSPPDLARLAVALKEHFPDATLHDHRK